MRVTEEIKYIGVNDHDIDLFEGQYVVENGMAYNSYVIIDEKIALYETQNAKIEAQVATTVEGYKEFESDTFANCKPEDLTLVLTLYPELSSNELVKQQIYIYQENNEKILALKEQKLNTLKINQELKS